MNNENSIGYQFSTPICKAVLKAFSDRQQVLIDINQQMQKTTDGIQSSNYNGRHSVSKLQRRIDPKGAGPKVEVIV